MKTLQHQAEQLRANTAALSAVTALYEQMRADFLGNADHPDYLTEYALGDSNAPCTLLQIAPQKSVTQSLMKSTKRQARNEKAPATEVAKRHAQRQYNSGSSYAERITSLVDALHSAGIEPLNTNHVISRLADGQLVRFKTATKHRKIMVGSLSTLTVACLLLQLPGTGKRAPS